MGWDEFIKALPVPALIPLGAVVGLGVLVRFAGLFSGMRVMPPPPAPVAPVEVALPSLTLP